MRISSISIHLSWIGFQYPINKTRSSIYKIQFSKNKKWIFKQFNSKYQFQSWIFHNWNSILNIFLHISIIIFSLLFQFKLFINQISHLSMSMEVIWRQRKGLCLEPCLRLSCKISFEFHFECFFGRRWTLAGVDYFQFFPVGLNKA